MFSNLRSQTLCYIQMNKECFICMCIPLSSHCMCCIWHNSTTGTCSCIATHVSTGVCCSLVRSTSSHSCWLAVLFYCRFCPECPHCLSLGLAHSNWVTSQCTPSQCPWACGTSRAFWSSGMLAVCSGWLELAPRARPGSTYPWGCSQADGTWGALSSKSWLCMSQILRDTCTLSACSFLGSVVEKQRLFSTLGDFTRRWVFIQRSITFV